MSTAPAFDHIRSAPAPARKSAPARWDRLQFDATAPPHIPDDEAFTGPRLVWSRGSVSERPDPAEWAGVVVRACGEALLGMRPAAQLNRWLDVTVWTALNRRAALGIQVAGRPQRPKPLAIRRVHTCKIEDTIWECSVVMHDGTRVRAAAVRLEEHRGRWIVTAVRIG